MGSAARAAGGLGLLAAPSAQIGPARRLALFGEAAESVAVHRMPANAGLPGECFRQGRAGTLLRNARILTAAGSALGVAGFRVPVAGRVGGAALLAASAYTRFGLFAAGVASTEDPRYVVEPQKRSAAARGA